MLQEKSRQKSSLCRFYLRGLCTHPKEQCNFSHGIDDLNYQLWQQGQEVEYDYLQNTYFCQRKAAKGSKNYQVLYEFQNIKKYSLEQLNTIKTARQKVRKKFHHKLFSDFMQLIQKVYSDANFTKDVLQREYTRVGFNKLMTRIKFCHLTDFLCQGENPRYYIKSMVMPPLVTMQQSFIIKRASQIQIIKCYRQEYLKVFKQTNHKIDEVTLKKKLYKIVYPNNNIPPLNLILKEKKINFTNFLKILDGKLNELLSEKIKLQPTLEQISKQAFEFLQSLKGKPTNWNEVYSFLCKKLRINNGNLINQIKPLLVNQGYRFLFFPMLQIIIPNFHKVSIESRRICKCKYQQPFDLSPFDSQFDKKKVILTEGQSVDVYDWQTLIKHARSILQSKVLGVDLEGTLRKGGFVQMLQLNNSQNTYLIDFYQLQQNKDQKTIQLLNKIIRNLFIDQNIVKIFHDSRHDSLALHQCIQTCIVNVFDTSAAETLKGQIQSYKTIDLSKADIGDIKFLIAECTNVKTYGLNDIFKKYNATHGQNKNKQRFHKIWKEGMFQFFLLRPLHPDYREYCVSDVLDLPEIYKKMISQVPNQMLSLIRWISAHYISFGFNICTKGEQILNQNKKLQLKHFLEADL